MSGTIRNFEPGAIWSDKNGMLSERAMGFLRDLFGYIGANTGSIPTGSLGGDGVSTTTFLREDGTFAVPSYPVGANPTGSAGLTAVNGAAVTFMRSDAAPAINQAIVPTWTGAHTFTAATVMAGLNVGGALSGVTTLVSTSSATIGTGFGCNGKTAQTSATVNAAIAATAGAAYTATEQGMLNDLKALVNQIRTALINDGIAV
jgi:hypothetical protein